jgi:hypothetical protein
MTLRRYHWFEMLRGVNAEQCAHCDALGLEAASMRTNRGFAQKEQETA